jgi:hypothetical protein
MIRRVLLAGAVFVMVMAGIAQSVDAPPAADDPLVFIPSDLLARLDALEAQNAELRAELDALEHGVNANSVFGDPLLQRYPIPSEVSLCGERLPLERGDVYPRFEEEWTRFLVNEHWLIKWLRRSRDIFPFVEARLAAEGMPEDLKYVLVVESGLESRAYSSAGAAGWWQFIKATGQRYGLARNNVVDERRDLGLATDAAIQYFRELHDEFGSWALALSAYNAGEKRVRDELEAQGEADFYALSLPRETEAYWFKAAAVKVLMENPAQYGIALSPDPWALAVCDTLELKVTHHRLQLREVAEAAGITYREFRELNPAFRRTWVPQGTHRFVLPHQSAGDLVEAVEGVQLSSRRPGEAFLILEDPPADVAVDADADAPDSGLAP